ncbi:M23 family metallopeptidase [Pandoraea sputorum]|uniref:M23 family peptidase n=1 Tax=Pandoraea sputorum TaxID=93222 RepID=A0A5E5AVD7_9BURK|nr:M23 family metallopeptidase [Pandoraea sputorum]VVE77791.1 M23 family peptidase [Pandoraea sputorum]
MSFFTPFAKRTRAALDSGAVATVFGLWMIAPLSAMAAAGDPLHLHPRLTTPLFANKAPSAVLPAVSVSQSVCGKITPLSPMPVSAASRWHTSAVQGRTSLFVPMKTARTAPSSTSFVTPVAGARVSSAFGTRHHPVRRVSHTHNGVDFAAPAGTPVLAAADGHVKFIGFERRGFGRYVVISHRYGSETVYAHLSATQSGLRIGDAVGAGDQIGSVGRTGMATGPHLHFELRRNGDPVDPRPLLSRGGADAVKAPAIPTADSGCQSVLNVVPSWHTHGRTGALPRWNDSPL